MMNNLNIKILPAKLADYSTIQKLWPFYVYDLGRECRGIKSWEWPTDPDFVSDDLTPYFRDATKKTFLIQVGDELAGFILINQLDVMPEIDFHLNDFFILAKFQNQGIGKWVAIEMFNQLKGRWAVSVIPENIKAVKFWRKIISEVLHGNYKEIFKTADELKSTENPDPHAMSMFIFDISCEVNPAKDEIFIRPSHVNDIQTIVEMSYQRRRDYEKAQPQFWKYAGPEAELSQAKWFEELLMHDDHITLIAKKNQEIVGFVIGKLISAPAVYNPGGLTLMIDDFCVQTEDQWPLAGGKLIEHIKEEAKSKGAHQMLVVCGAHDKPKRRFLMNQNLSIASEWFVGDIT